MARPIDEFSLAWNSLSDSSTKQGWRSIPVSPAGQCELRAGRRFPENIEALLVGLPLVEIPAAEKLPEGQGFQVLKMDFQDSHRTWLALTRKESGNLELFAAMASDMAALLDAHAQASAQLVLHLFLRRVHAWQEFMRKGKQYLSPEAELGLFGELWVLKTILELGQLTPVATIQAWKGPLDAPQDFDLGAGALEVKTTLAACGFPAKIRSLDQLDDSVRQPIFVAGVRLSSTSAGWGLASLVQTIRERLVTAPEACRIFNERLIAAGYPDAHAQHYTRRFSVSDLRIWEVTDSFPRLTSSCVPAGVMDATYKIDLEKTSIVHTAIDLALKKLGVL